MVTNFFKNIGKGILNVLTIPAMVIGWVVFGVFGFVIFIFTAFKKAFLFVTGRSVSNDLPEDIEAKRLIKEASEPEEKVEIVKAYFEDPNVMGEHQQSAEPKPIPKEVGNYVIDQDVIKSEIENNEMKEIEFSQDVKNETTVREIEQKSDENNLENYEPKVGKF